MSMNLPAQSDVTGCTELKNVSNNQNHHGYYRASASKAQLEVMVAELQQKMVALQRRQRNHQGALLALEDTVSQLRRDDLLGEERRQLLEQAYMQTRAAVSEAGEMVAVVSEEDRGAPLHAQLTDEDEDL